MGDASDNIPGVPGIGEKTAMSLLTRFGSLEGVYEHLEDPSLTPSQKKKLQAGQDSARLSFELALGVVDAPITATLDSLSRGEMDKPGLFLSLIHICWTNKRHKGRLYQSEQRSPLLHKGGFALARCPDGHTIFA